MSEGAGETLTLWSSGVQESLPGHVGTLEQSRARSSGSPSTSVRWSRRCVLLGLLSVISGCMFEFLILALA